MSGSFFRQRYMAWRWIYILVLAIFVKCCAATNITALEEYTISFGNTSSWCPKICFCPLLVRADCSKLELNSVSGDMFPINSTKLRDLWLDSSSIKTIEPNVFHKMKYLRALILSNNKLKALHHSLFSTLVNLKVLDLSNNKLNSALDNRLFQALHKLETLNLAFNKITTLDARLLMPLTSISSLILSGNPFNCDCELRNAVVWTRNKGLETQATCKYPKTGERWEELTIVSTCLDLPSTDINVNDDFDEKTKESFPIVTIIIIIVISVMLALMCLGIALYCWRHKRIQQSDSPTDVRRENEMKMYDDIKPSEYYYYESIRTHGTKYLSVSSGIVPQLPERPRPNVEQVQSNSNTNSRISNSSPPQKYYGTKSDTYCESDSYVEPDTPVFWNINLNSPSEKTPIPVASNK